MNKYQKWKEGMKNLTPEQLIKAKLVGLKGTMIGLSLACATLLYRFAETKDYATLGFGIFLVFLVYLQYIDHVKTKQQYDNIKKLEGDLDGL